jgi:hypothetical protein
LIPQAGTGEQPPISIAERHRLALHI